MSGQSTGVAPGDEQRDTTQVVVHDGQMTIDQQIVNVCDGQPWVDPTRGNTRQWLRCAACDRAARDNRRRIDREII